MRMMALGPNGERIEINTEEDFMKFVEDRAREENVAKEKGEETDEKETNDRDYFGRVNEKELAALKKALLSFMTNRSSNTFTDDSALSTTTLFRLSGSCACGTCREGDTTSQQARDYQVVSSALHETLTYDGLAGFVPLANVLRTKCDIPEYGARIALGTVCELLNYQLKGSEQQATYESYIVEFFNLAVRRFSEIHSHDTEIIISKISKIAIDRNLTAVWGAFTDFIFSRFEADETTEKHHDTTFALCSIIMTDETPNGLIAPFRRTFMTKITEVMPWNDIVSIHSKWYSVITHMIKVREFDIACPLIVASIQKGPSVARRIVEQTYSKNQSKIAKLNADSDADVIEYRKGVSAKLRMLMIDAITEEENARLAIANNNNE